MSKFNIYTLKDINCNTCIHQEILHQYEKRQCTILNCDTSYSECICNGKHYVMNSNFKRGKKNNA